MRSLAVSRRRPVNLDWATSIFTLSVTSPPRSFSPLEYLRTTRQKCWATLDPALTLRVYAHATADRQKAAARVLGGLVDAPSFRNHFFPSHLFKPRSTKLSRRANPAIRYTTQLSLRVPAAMNPAVASQSVKTLNFMSRINLRRARDTSSGSGTIRSRFNARRIARAKETNPIAETAHQQRNTTKLSDLKTINSTARNKASPSKKTRTVRPLTLRCFSVLGIRTNIFVLGSDASFFGV